MRSDKKRISQLKRELQNAAAKDRPALDPDDAAHRARALGLAFRIITDLVAAPIVGCVIGWLIDRVSGLGPLFLVVFFFLGLAAGIINVMRTAKEMNRKNNHNDHKDPKDNP